MAQKTARGFFWCKLYFIYFRLFPVWYCAKWNGQLGQKCCLHSVPCFVVTLKLTLHGIEGQTHWVIDPRPWSLRVSCHNIFTLCKLWGNYNKLIVKLFMYRCSLFITAIKIKWRDCKCHIFITINMTQHLRWFFFAHAKPCVLLFQVWAVFFLVD